MSSQKIISNSVGNDGRHYRITVTTVNGKIIQIKRQVYERNAYGDMVLSEESGETGEDLKLDNKKEK